MGTFNASAVLAACGMLALPGQAMAQASAADLARIEHIVVIYAENRSFDHLYGFFQGANGIAQATDEQKTQLDHDGTPLPYLVVFDHGKPAEGYPQLPNGPFPIDGVPLNKDPGAVLPSPIHAFYHNVEQINGGRNNMFAAMSNRGGWVMGYFDGRKLKSWTWAQEYTLADNFFMAAFGGSYLNHHWLICACTPRYENAPEKIKAVLDENGKLKKKPESPSARDGAVDVFSAGGGTISPDGYSVNTIQPPYQPSGTPPAPDGNLDLAQPVDGRLPVLPPQSLKTIGDTLSAKGVTWAWYAGGWTLASQDGRRPAEEKRRVIYNREPGSPNFQPHHQPFNYYTRFAPGTEDRMRHLKDGEDFFRAIDEGTLPSVAFYKPVGILTQHPSYTDLLSGDAHIADTLERLRKSPQWSRMLVVVTYDENGGFWDHVPPPAGDRFGPGTRIPGLIVSPFAKRGFVDHTVYDTTSILKLITRRFDLEPLPGVRANVGDLTNALTFAP